MDDFTKAYIEAALWASTDGAGEPLDAKYSEDDLTVDTLNQIKNDCRDFQKQNAADLATAYGIYRRNEWTPEAQAGHDFFLTRSHHGAGFWDRDLGEVGDKLTEASRAWGSFSLHVADDGKLFYLLG